MRSRLALAVVATALGACTCGEHRPSVADAGHASSRSSADASPPLPGDEPVRPVYDVSGPIDPRAQRLCDAIDGTLASRRAECCHAPVAPTAAHLCAETVSAALRLGGVTLSDSALATCEAAITAEHQGCEWVGPYRPRLPPACATVLTGTLASGAKCRSSLECQGALRCLGSGPTDVGVCGPGRTDGSCNTSVDALASFLDIDISRSHPACAGFCERTHCLPAKAVGAACTFDLQCPAGSHCAQSHCAEGAVAAEGAPCSGACADGTRCIDGACAKPKPAGAACSNPFECEGGCLKADGGRVCGMLCGLAR